MLYDPKWEKQAETRADPFSLGSLIAWLEAQPATKQYDYCEPRTCLVAQYLIASGVPRFELMPNEIEALGWDPIVLGDSGREEEWTFGAALERAKLIAAR